MAYFLLFPFTLAALYYYPAYVAYDEHVYRLPGTTAPNRQVFA